MDADFNAILNDTLGLEGGLDTTMEGVVSNFGIRQNTYDSYNQRNNKEMKDVKEISYGEVRDIGYKDYFEPMKLDKIDSPIVKGTMFDFGYNSGNSQAVKTLQSIVGTKEDGIMGKKTLKATKKFIEEYGDKVLGEALLSERENFLVDLTVNNPEKYGKYAQGWINRMSKQRQKYLQ